MSRIDGWVNPRENGIKNVGVKVIILNLFYTLRYSLFRSFLIEEFWKHLFMTEKV